MEQITNIYDARVFLQRNTPKSQRRVCALTRVSTLHEQQTNALVNQNQWIIDEIGRHSDWVFDMTTDLYVDEGVSGTSTHKRTGFNTMIKNAKAGKYDLIVTREVCRFMRNAKLTLNLVDELEKSGVEVYFVNDGIWSFNKDDYFKLTIMATYAEQESRKVSERVFSGQATARANGIHFGTGNILGYDIVKGEKSYQTTYIVNEEQAKTVRLIYDLVIKGFGIRKIKIYLEDNGYKTAEGNLKWHMSSIERILRRRTYMGEYEYLQSVTIDPLTHERINQTDKDRRVRKKGDFPAIIEPDLWFKVQDIIDSRINHNFVDANNKSETRGTRIGKDIYQQKMRCGCGRRLKKDIGRADGTATYRCYGVVDDGGQEKRLERSKILNDNCSVYGIIDWKLDLFTLKVFDYLNCNIEVVKERIIEIINKVFVSSGSSGVDVTDKLKLEMDIKHLEERKARLLDALSEGVINKEDYKVKREEFDYSIGIKKVKLKELEKCEILEDEKQDTLNKIQEFVNSSLEFPCLNGDIIKVPDKYIDVFVNSIKACANNVFEYNIRVNPKVKCESPLVVPDEEYIPSVHSATKILDNSDAVLLAEFEVDYATAKEYANRLKRKVVRVHWEVPAKIKIFVNVD